MTGYKACPNCEAALRPMTLFCPKCGTAVMPSVNNTLLISLQQTLESLKPGQAEVLRRCAIPRWFDCEILAVLRDREDGANQRILDQLASYSFVRELSNGRYTYTEDVRALLLDEWRTRPEELRPIQKRLYHYFEQRMDSTELENRATWLREIVTYDLMLASATIVEDQLSTEPLLLMPSTLNARLNRALLRFQSLVESALQGFRLAEAEALLIAAEEQSSILAPKILHWLQYYRACLEHLNLNFESAIRTLEQLLEHSELDQELRTSAMIKLGEVFVETSSWARAIHTYQQVLEFPDLAEDQKAAIHLGIGDAYNEIAINAGGWYIPASSRRPILRILIWLVQTTLVLPTLVIVWILRKLGAIVPPTRILLPYQNWLLARIFRASREEVLQAREIYVACADTTNITRCDMRLVESDVIFGLHQQAIERAKSLLAQPKVTDGYRRARIELTYAHALFAHGDTAQARALAEYTLTIFRKLKDIRWESRALILLGRIAIVEQNIHKAVETFTEALRHARDSGSVLSRERALYELRVWRRSAQEYPQKIDTLIETEPVQRFVARFPRFLLPVAQIAQMISLPGFLILSSILVPQIQPSDIILTLDNNSVITGPEILTFPLWRLAISSITGLIVIGTAYIMIGIVVLWRMPIARFQAKQPEIVEVTPQTVLKYNQSGLAETPLELAQLQQVTTTNRTVSNKNLHVFSGTFLHDTAGNEIRIDGITSWYGSAIWLIKQRAQQLGTTFTNRNLDSALMGNWVGITLAIGVFLLVFFVSSGNKWVFNAAEFLPPNIYAFFQQLGYSGLLIIIPFLHWILFYPLRVIAKVGHQPRRPIVIAAMVFGGFLLGLVFLGDIVQIPIFRTTLLFTGIVLLAEGCYQWWSRVFQKRHWVGVLRLIELAMIALGLFVLWPSVKTGFLEARSYAYALQGDELAAASDQFAVDNVQNQQQPAGSLPNQPNGGKRSPLSMDDQYDPHIHQDILDSYTNGEIELNNDDLGITYHNLASAQIKICRDSPRSPECVDYAQIIENEVKALEYTKDRRVRSLAYEQLGWLYTQQGACATALAAYNNAIEAARDQKRIDQIEREIAQSGCP